MKKTNWLLSTIGKRGYIADYLREADPDVYIVGTGNTQFTAGFARCDEAVLLPQISSAGYLDAVRELVESRQIDAILSLSDPDVATLSLIREELTDRGVSCFFPGAALANMGFDKFETSRWAQANGILTPRTFQDPQEALETAGLPLVRKPRFGSGSAGVAFVRSASELQPAAHDKTDYIYQEMICGGEEVNVEICGDLQGRPLSVSCWRKMISRNGETELAVTVRRQDLMDYGLRLATKAAIPGPCDVDVIDRDGQLYLIEFNMRFGGGYPVSQLADARFLEKMVRVHRGERPMLHTGFAGDIFMMKTLQPFGGRLDEASSKFRMDDFTRRKTARQLVEALV